MVSHSQSNNPERPLIVVVGAGAVGTATAYEIARSGAARVGIYDIEKNTAMGRVTDIAHAINCPASVYAIRDTEELAKADLIVVTAGIARKRGMSRDDLLAGNASIVLSVLKEIRSYRSTASVLIVTNPTEALVKIASDKYPGFNIFGLGCSLDKVRLESIIASHLSVCTDTVEGLVYGIHGAQMIISADRTTIDGVALKTLIDSKDLDRIVKETRDAGTTIVNLLSSHSGHVAAGATIARVALAFVGTGEVFFPLSTTETSLYQLEETCVALPCAIGRSRVDVQEIHLSDVEKSALDACSEHVRDMVARWYNAADKSPVNGNQGNS